MICTRIERNNISKYINIFEKIGLFLKSEFFTALVFLKMYNIENEIYNKRKICWSLILGLPVIAFMLIIFSACVKYLIVG